MFRQGDIIIKKRYKKPKNAKPIDPPKLSGETGNPHLIPDASWFNLNGVLIAVLENDGYIIHREHGKLNIPKGIYEVRHLKDYKPIARSRSYYDVYD
ncbi:MAG: hypothetical protein ACTSRZ_07885 [Promethearchaeota archaeon]